MTRLARFLAAVLALAAAGAVAAPQPVERDAVEVVDRRPAQPLRVVRAARPARPRWVTLRHAQPVLRRRAQTRVYVRHRALLR